MPESEHIRFAIADAVATIGLNRPEKRNAVSLEMWETIAEHLETAAAEPGVRGLVLEGLPGVFCAGADLTAVKNADAAVATHYREVALTIYSAIRDFPHPTVAAVDGLCIGGGNNLALACDIRIAGPQASFAIPAVRHGIVYDENTVSRLVELVGSGRASYYLFTAQSIGAVRAAEIGLVDVAADNLATEVEAFLTELRLADMPALNGIREHIRSAANKGRRGWL
jgi:enoyl-CoA hydratase/carnithine racemase